MKKIDRYILVKYLTTFFFCLLLFTTIVVVVDVSEKTDDFVRSDLSAWRIFMDYYLGFIPRIDAMLFPLFTFISVIFFTSKMAGRSEVIAILSAGVSFRRFMLPFMVGGFILSGLLWLGYQFLVPVASKKWADFDKVYLRSANSAANFNNSYKTNMYFKMDADAWVGIKGYDTISKTGSNIFIQKFKKNKLVYNLRASNFNWDTLKGNWKLTYVTERYVDSINERVVTSASKSVAYNFKPMDLRRDEYLKDQMITKDLNAFIRAEKDRGSEALGTLLIERYNRDAIPFSVLVLTVIGVALAARRVRGGSGAHLAIGVVISVAYILCGRLTLVFATKGNFSPFMAAWTPNIIFGILAIYLYIRAPK